MKKIKIKKEVLEYILETVIKGLEPNNVRNGFDYSRLYPKDVTEADIAHAVRDTPELHSQMEKLVRSVIRLISLKKVSSIWIDEEEQAGCLLSYALAIYDKKYCKLFAESLLFQDLDHEVNQNDYIHKIFKKWGVCNETVIVLKARMENSGQWGNDLVSELIDKYEGLTDYIDEVSDEDNEDVLEPSVSLKQIDSTKNKKKLEQYYSETMVDFIREIGSFIVEILNSYAKSKAKVSVLSVKIDSVKISYEFSIVDTKGNVVENYQIITPKCLVPFDKVCLNLNYQTHEKIEELIPFIQQSVIAGCTKWITSSFVIEIDYKEHNASS